MQKSEPDITYFRNTACILWSPNGSGFTLRETNVAHESQGLEDVTSFWGPAFWQVRTVSFRQGIYEANPAEILILNLL